MSQRQPRFNLSTRILFALILGLLVGALMEAVKGSIPWLQPWVIDGLLRFVGEVFVRLLQFLVVPLVLVSLVCGVSNLSEPAKLGRLGLKSVGLYLITTMVAVGFALVAALVYQPGAGRELGMGDYIPAAAPPVIEVLIGMVPRNPFDAMASGQMLQVIVFAILLGLAIMLSGERGKRIAGLFDDMNEVVMTLVRLIMNLAPYGVFALIARLVGNVGLGEMQGVAHYFGLVLFCLLAHLFITYPLMLKLFTGLSPLVFLRKLRAMWLFAFSTASSNATIPVTLRTVEQGLGVNNSVASFTVPLGATLNMDGTAIMQGVATVFIAQIYQVDLSTGQLLTVMMMATLASIGTAGVPSAGLILLATVLMQIGLPVEAISLIIGIDRLLDMVRTAVNVTGDAAVSVIVGKSEGAFSAEIYNDPHAGVEEAPKAVEETPKAAA